ncbi:hypothetical protein ACFWBN_07065 [Streptomyces sp. NPDC059989]|uniref:hypothetical protein n=1 Tax=Streptomyces sp. NPDC059989 TaxID=3347026 RepID=UPI003686B4A8
MSDRSNRRGRAWAAVLLLPPLPGTPAARRCPRTPPGRIPASAPGLLSTLEPS